MIHFEPGDMFPGVAFVQARLNVFFGEKDRLRVDADFGALTQAAVMEFQQATGEPVADGYVYPDTWLKLALPAGLLVRDIVDVFDDGVQRRAQALEHIANRPIVFGGGSFALAWVVPSLIGSGVNKGRLLLLRLHGHGGPAQQILGHGSSCQVLWKAIRLSDEVQMRPKLDKHGRQVYDKNGDPVETCGFDATRSEKRRVTREAVPYSQLDRPALHNQTILKALSGLKPLYSPFFSSIEFHGCMIAAGPDGKRFLREAAAAFRTPVAASTQIQAVRADATHFSGPVRVHCPHEVPLKVWAAEQWARYKATLPRASVGTSGAERPDVPARSAP